MTYQMRPLTLEEWPALVRAFDIAFGGTSTDQEIERYRATFEPDRSLAMFDGERIVATAGALSLELTLPGSVCLPVAGVAYVTVLPTYRRRGLLSQMMRRQLADVRARGEALAALHASESVIYGRFGYGVATSYMHFEIERHHAQLAQHARAVQPEGELRLVEQAEALPRLIALYDELRLRQPGALGRTPTFWETELLAPVTADSGVRFFVVYEGASGRVEGAAYYRPQRQWTDNLPQTTVLVEEVLAVTSAARAALWRYLLALDLVAKIRAVNRPIDEPLRWMLADPRRLRVTAINDDLWLRLIDIPVALAARRYAGAGRLVLAVEDAFLPENTGCYALECGPDGAECRRGDGTDDAADLALGVADLGAVFLGGVRFSTLAAAGRVEERSPGALARADALFAA
ncbi:MAG TPA: GNAT family N-acetyltransferase, partial [Ktedonobacterales bacterium]|nr:GNAT family N-acetyltransferase [Ktedonobacterales bacterium]